MLSELAEASDVVNVSSQPRDIEHRGRKGRKLGSALGFSARNECDIVESLGELSQHGSDGLR
jgi:hypothetical protein